MFDADSQLDNRNQSGLHEQVDEIYLVGLVAKDAVRPPSNDRLLYWRKQ